MATQVVAPSFGGPDVLTIVDEAVAEPGQGEVLVDVRAAGTNPADFKFYEGVFGKDPSLLPLRIGSEAAGVVAAVGEGADGPMGPVQVGDEVIAFPISGAYASQIVVPALSVVPKPSTLSFEEASGLMLTGTTAFHALSVIDLEAGDTVVVHGAAGGVGQMAVQLAVNTGARVIGTSSESGHEFLRALGAEPVAYGEGLVERIRSLAPGGIDAAIDTVGSDEALEASVVLVADRDRVASIAGFSRQDLGVKLLGAGPGADPGTEIRSAARLELVRLAAAGKIRVTVARTYPLIEAAEANAELARGHTHGKIVLVPEVDITHVEAKGSHQQHAADARRGQGRTVGRRAGDRSRGVRG